jgi:hypothetical protein
METYIAEDISAQRLKFGNINLIKKVKVKVKLFLYHDMKAYRQRGI